MKYRALFILVCIFLVDTAQSIDKEIHPIITFEAINQFNGCARKLGISPVPDSYAAILAEYSGREDDLTLDRVLNWHFYDHYRDSDYAMSAYKSLHRIFKERIDSIVLALKSSNDEDFYEAAGRILHYIQDMAIPAHVAPNYHVKAEKKWQSIFVRNEPDPLDILMNPNNFTYEIPPGRCEFLYELNEKKFEEYSNTQNIYFSLFQDLLVTFAENTREEIVETKFPGSKYTFEEEFWILRSPEQEHRYPGSIKKGFAPYGKYNDRERFSLDSGICIKYDNGDLCKAFIAKRYSETINFTIRALMYISDFLNSYKN